MTVHGRGRKFQEERTNNGNSRARHFLRRGIEVRKKPVALLNVAAPNSFLFRPMYPWFLISRTLRGVVAINRLECSDLDPLSQQIRLWSAGKTANIGTHHAETTQAEIEQHRSGEAKMVPCAAVISRP